MPMRSPVVRTAVRAAALAVCGALAAAPARAQLPPPAPEDLADRARIRSGPFYLQPWLTLANAGLDTNVFNDYEEPKEDYTFTLTPGVDAGMRAGVARLNVRLVADYVWYQTYKSEQGIDTSTRAQFELRYVWLRPYASAEFVQTRSRVGYEIDARAERSLPTYEGGLDVRLASRTWLALSYRQASVEFRSGELFDGVSLDRALNNTSQAANAALRLELTPLTTVTLLTQLERVRFDHSRFRDNRSYAFLPTFDFSPDALVGGRAMVGFRDLRADTTGVPDFKGLVANASLRYTPLPSTSLGISVDRDVTYSFEDFYPYFLQTGASASVTQRLVKSYEVSGHGRREWLDYRPIEGAAVPRTDTVTSFGVGVGYRFGDLGRLGVDVERVERRSDLASRGYSGTRVYGSARYGF